MKSYPVILLVILILLLESCAPITSEPQIIEVTGTSVLPSPTLMKDTPIPLETQVVNTPTLTEPTQYPTHRPTITREVRRTETSTPQPTSTMAIGDPPPTIRPLPLIRADDIQIFNPGRLSKVISPIQTNINIKLSHNGKVQIELYGEDGRVLFQSSKKYYAQPAGRIFISEEIEFNIKAIGELGRLTISLLDDKGNYVALNSVELILLSMGEDDFNPSDATDTNIIIITPYRQTTTRGGMLKVSGYARFNHDDQFILQLADANGEIKGQAPVLFHNLVQDKYWYFTSEIPYDVNTYTPVRLSVIISDGRPTDIRYITSIDIYIAP